MRAIFDFIKEKLVQADGLWIESAGNPIIIQGFFSHNNGPGTETYIPRLPILIYGFYNYPQTHEVSFFSVDSPDEIEVQVNIRTTCLKLGTIPAIGTLLRIEDGNWIITDRSYIYNRFIGKYRLSLFCQRFQESITTGNNGTCTKSKEHTTMDEEE